jgi:hypothetical protein
MVTLDPKIELSISQKVVVETASDEKRSFKIQNFYHSQDLLVLIAETL